MVSRESLGTREDLVTGSRARDARVGLNIRELAGMGEFSPRAQTILLQIPHPPKMHVPPNVNPLHAARDPRPYLTPNQG